MLSTIRKAHHALGQEQAVLRAFLGFANRLLPSLSMGEKNVIKLVDQLKRLEKRNPNMLRPSHLYFQDLVSLSNRLNEERARDDGPDRSQKFMALHSDTFRTMSQERKTNYDRKLPIARDASFRGIADERKGICAKRRKVDEEIAKENVGVPCLKLECARFKKEHEVWVNDRLHSPFYSEKRVNERVKVYVEAPPSDPAYVDPGPEPIVEGVARPQWFASACERREAFDG